MMLIIKNTALIYQINVVEIVNYDTAGLYRIEHPKIEKQTIRALLKMPFG